MSQLVFRLRNVPEEEADEVRQLLDESHIDWFETSGGTWGTGMPGIWVRDRAQAETARAFIDEYQQQRSIIHQRENAMGPSASQTIGERLRTQPWRIIGIVIFCIFLIYVSTKPFLKFLRPD